MMRSSGESAVLIDNEDRNAEWCKRSDCTICSDVTTEDNGRYERWFRTYHLRTFSRHHERLDRFSP